MVLTGPDSFDLACSSEKYTLMSADGSTKFNSRAASKLPKLYVVSSAGAIVYVGVTKQSMSARFRLGWKATGASGYYGYAWRHALAQAKLHVWYHEDAGESRSSRDVETVEAEVAFLVRQAGQWPAHQTEIHFFPSSDVHRAHARRVFEFATASC